MSKTIYEFYAFADFKRTGKAFTVHIIPDDDYTPHYPFTDIPVPQDLQTPDKVPFFDPTTQTWVDKSDNAEILAAKQNQDDLAAAKQDAADAKAENATLKDTVTTVKGALKELMTYVSTLPVPDTTETQGGAE